MNIFKEGKLELWRLYCENMKSNPKLRCLFWETTLKCNLNCKHCGSSCSPDQNNKDELSTDEIKGTIKSIKENYNPQDILLIASGGEPLLRKDLFEVMDYASKLGFPWGMVTNGTLITKEICEKLKETGMKTVSVSLDGTKTSHNQIRGTGVFEKATEGVKNLVDSKYFNEVEIITCVHKENINELDDICNLCIDLGVKYWRIFTIVPTGRAKEHKNMLLEPKEYIYVLDYIRKKRKEVKKQLTLNFCDEGFLGPEYEGEVREHFFFCWAGITVGSILHNGDVAGCPIIPREKTIQGNIREQNFHEIWENEYQIFRDRNWKKQKECKKCSFWNYCEGNSMHLWDFEKEKLKVCNYNIIEGEKK